jgi:hypothetical protein
MTDKTQGNNVFQGFDKDLLAESFNVPPEIAEKLQGTDTSQSSGIINNPDSDDDGPEAE